MKISNKRIMQIFSHCVNKNRTKLTKSNYKEEIIDKINSIPNLEIKFECSCGASKLVLRPIDNDNHFVIKIPFTGDERDNVYHPFTWEDGGITWYIGNYCDIEAERCKVIINNGWGDFIAKTSLIGIIDDLFIYKQELVDTIAEDKIYNGTNFSIWDEASNYTSEEIDEYWVTELKDFAGEETAIQFIQFLESEGFCGDIHGANCGFKKDGTPVIFDYSDFWS